MWRSTANTATIEIKVTFEVDRDNDFMTWLIVTILMTVYGDPLQMLQQ